MEHNCVVFVRKCIKCQLHGDVMRTPPIELYSMNAPWPCSMWDMDVIGTIDPPASNGHRFILWQLNTLLNRLKPSLTGM